MLDYGLMDLITELETEFASLSESASPSSVTVSSFEQETELRLPQLGKDFVAGLANGVVRVVPLSNLLQIRGSHLPVRTDQTLSEFLLRQRTPIRLRLRTVGREDSGWLLNLEAGWLRVALSQGISWVPLEAVTQLEILPVDNSNH
jgi:hypothetical protein